MKTTIKLLFIIGLMLALNACKKENTTIAAITGKWNLVSDSTYAGVGYNNHPVNYIGQPGDYFNFTADGLVYTKEGSVLDTLTYSIQANNQLNISGFGIILNGVPELSQISNFTAHTLKITAPRGITPGGQFGRVVSLTR
ncbi:hypothetical protein [Mucilaginibacter sp.]|uniref:hypothetical protein n=1 Tax=Mucilaginibacter sp. TaxID=1882438 RepID=UPI003D09B88C